MVFSCSELLSTHLPFWVWQQGLYSWHTEGAGWPCLLSPRLACWDKSPIYSPSQAGHISQPPAEISYIRLKMHGNVFYWVINVPNVFQIHTLKSDDKLSIEKKESITDWSYQSPTISLQPVLIFVHILKEILKTGETYSGKKKKIIFEFNCLLFHLINTIFNQHQLYHYLSKSLK